MKSHHLSKFRVTVFPKLTASVYIPAAVVKYPDRSYLQTRGLLWGRVQGTAHVMGSPSNKSLRCWPEASIIKKLGVMNTCDGCSLSSLYTVQNLSLGNSVTRSRVDGLPSSIRLDRITPARLALMPVPYWLHISSSWPLIFTIKVMM